MIAGLPLLPKGWQQFPWHVVPEVTPFAEEQGAHVACASSESLGLGLLVGLTVEVAPALSVCKFLGF